MAPLREDEECDCALLVAQPKFETWTKKVAKTSGKDYYFRKYNGTFQSFGCGKDNRIWIKLGQQFVKNVNMVVKPTIDLLQYSRFVENAIGDS